MVEPIDEYFVTPHAEREMRRRGIESELLRRVLAAPEQRLSVRRGRDVLQSRFTFDGKLYLVRVFADVERTPPEIVTIYRTSNVAKYWRAQP